MNLKSLTADKLIGAAARFFSTVLNPLLAPAYGVFLVLWTSVLCYLPSGTRMAVLTVIFGTTCILPMILIGVLHNFKIVKNKRLDDPKERFYPYLFTILCYIGAASYLNHTHARSSPLREETPGAEMDVANSSGSVTPPGSVLLCVNHCFAERS